MALAAETESSARWGLTICGQNVPVRCALANTVVVSSCSCWHDVLLCNFVLLPAGRVYGEGGNYSALACISSRLPRVFMAIY